MFSKSRINDQGNKPEAPRAPEATLPAAASRPAPAFEGRDPAPYMPPKTKPQASVLSADLTVTGNLRTTGDIVIEGVIDGDIRAHLLTVGETATIRGEIVADDIVINGRVTGRVRGLKVRLTSTARVEGDIIHKTIAIESGAHFDGSVQRQDDPLGTQAAPRMAPPQPAPQMPPQPAPQPARAPAQSAAAPKAPVDTAKIGG